MPKFNIMKKYFFVLMFTCFTATAFSQVENYGGSQSLRIGANFFGNDNNLKLTYNYGINEMFTVGAGVYTFNDSYAFVRGDFHLGSVVTLPDNLGVFAGIELGVIGIDFLNFDPQLGVAYSLTQNMDVYLEFGNTGTIGVSFSF